MLRHSRSSHSRSGVAAVETAVILPFLAIMMIGLWEVGQLVETQQLLTNAAREGARRASTGASTGTYTSFYSDIQTLCTNYLSAAGVNTTGITVTVTDVTLGSGSSFNPPSANQGDQLVVVVTIPFNNVRWVLIPQMFPTNANISGGATWCSMVDLPVTVSTTLPQG
jgi:Flp pilus assembly protein TadG